MQSSKKSLLIGLAALLWCFGMIVLYFISHKPLTPGLAAALGLLIWRLIVALALVSLGGGIGSLIYHDAQAHPLTRLALQAGLGLGAISLSVLIIGSTIGLPGWLLWLALPVLLAVFFRQVRAWWQQWRSLADLWKGRSRFSLWVSVLCGLLLLCTLLVALAPPLKFDSLTYHLVQPNAYLSDGRVSYLPWIVMTGMPQNSEMLYTWAIALGGNSAATTLAWFFGLLTLVGLAGYLYQTLDGPSAWAGIACLLAGFTTSMVMGWGYVDWLVMLMGLGALVSLDGWRRTGQSRQLVLAGVFTGLAIGAKYTSGVLALTGSVALLWHVWKRRALLVPAFLHYGLAALLVSLPWFLKNWLTTGNPLYPFVFPGGAMTAVRLSVYQNLGAWGNWLDFFLLPLRATYLGFDSGDGYMASIGPLLVGLGCLAWLAWMAGPKHSTEARQSLENAAALGLAGWLVWAVGNRLSGNLIQTRYYFSVFPAFAMLGAAGYWGIRRIELLNIRLGMIVSALVVLVLGLNLVEVGVDVTRQGTLPVVLGLKDQESFLGDNLGWYQPAMLAVSQLPVSDRTLLLFESRSLYCMPRCAPDEILDHWKRDRAALQDAELIRQSWLAQGFTHVLFYRTGADFLVDANDPHHTRADLDALKAFLNTLPAPVDFGGVYQLYSLK
jgi:hypothetical protein